VHYEKFAMDSEGKNTYRHKMAGAELVTARGFYETDVLFQERLSIYKVASFYDTDFLILEGAREENVPKIVTADKISDLDERVDDHTFLISGKIADTIESYKDLEAISAFKDIERLVDIIENKTFELLPDYDPKCCRACGYTCRELCVKIIKGEMERGDCILSQNNVNLKINGVDIKMVPFVENTIVNTIKGLLMDLDGYQSDTPIEISIGETIKE
jgi:molybdopterin-guanine dinucleotide biosynthesis protein B